MNLDRQEQQERQGIWSVPPQGHYWPVPLWVYDRDEGTAHEAQLIEERVVADEQERARHEYDLMIHAGCERHG